IGTGVAIAITRPARRTAPKDIAELAPSATSASISSLATTRISVGGPRRRLRPRERACRELDRRAGGRRGHLIQGLKRGLSGASACLAASGRPQPRPWFGHLPCP